MVVNCVASDCKNLGDARYQLSFHMFPFKRPEILKLWITAIGRRDWFPSKSSRLCGEHFLETDYQNRPGCTARLLKLDAVPSVFSFPTQLFKRVVLPNGRLTAYICNDVNEDPRDNDINEISTANDINEVPPDNNINEVLVDNDIKNEVSMDNDINEVPMDVVNKVPIDNDIHEVRMDDIDLNNTNSQLSLTPTLQFVNCGTQTTTDYYSTLPHLRRTVKTLKQKLRRRDLKILSMTNIINEISKSGHSTENLNAVLKNYCADKN